MDFVPDELTALRVDRLSQDMEHVHHDAAPHDDQLEERLWKGGKRDNIKECGKKLRLEGKLE